MNLLKGSIVRLTNFRFNYGELTRIRFVRKLKYFFIYLFSKSDRFKIKTLILDDLVPSYENEANVNSKSTDFDEVFTSALEVGSEIKKQGSRVAAAYLYTRNFIDHHKVEIAWAGLSAAILSSILLPSLVTLVLVDKPLGTEKFAMTIKAIGNQ